MKRDMFKTFLKYLDNHRWQGRMFIFFCGISMTIIAYRLNFEHFLSCVNV